MNHSITISIILCFLLVSCGATAEHTEAESDQSAMDMSDKAEKMDEIFSEWDHKTTPGCAVAATREGRPLLSSAYGMADLEHQVPNTPSTIFEAGSVSKQFVAASVILLKLEGKLSLEDEVSEYIPELPDYDETITIRHMLTHTSGLRDWGSVAAISGWGRSSRTHGHEHVLDILSRQSLLNFSPGEFYSYSNSGYNLAAIIVSRVSDQSFAEFSQEHLFKPLGMTDTQWRDDYTRIVEGRSSAYTARNDSFTINRPIENVHGNGGLLTTVGDLNIWNDALQSGRLAGGELADILHQMGELNNGRTNNYANGVREGTHDGAHYYGHTGATSGYRAFLRRYPEQHLSVALLCNVTGASPGSLGSRVAELFLEEKQEEDPDFADGIDLPADELEARTGTYIHPHNYRATHLTVENDTLQTEGGTALIPESPQKFRVGSSERHFVFNEEGDIQRMVEGYEEGKLKKVEAYPSGQDAELFAGVYYSEDAETRITIEAEDEKLKIHRRPDDTFEAEPEYRDAFSGGFGMLNFHRNDDGEIEQMSLSRGRVYDMRFDRTEE